MSKWMNCELNIDEARRFRGYLKDMDIRFEASAAYNLIHFECFMNELEARAANEFLDNM